MGRRLLLLVVAAVAAGCGSSSSGTTTGAATRSTTTVRPPLAPIVITSPAPDALVPLAVPVAGSASVFEATLVVELVRGGKVLDKRSVTASEGAPGRGTFATTLRAPSPGAATISAFAPSAADGSPQHRIDVPVTVSP
jgi:hypothetical protein